MVRATRSTAIFARVCLVNFQDYAAINVKP
jgi:hypothetical protein